MDLCSAIFESVQWVEDATCPLLQFYRLMQKRDIWIDLHRIAKLELDIESFLHPYGKKLLLVA